MSPVAIRLKQLREGRGWTQSELSARTGVTVAAISRIENNLTKSVEFDTLDKLAEALEVHPAALIERIEG